MKEIIRPLDNPIRIKITGKCNRCCFFCHKEGNMDIDTVFFSDALKQSVERLSRDFNMHSVAITGGEPLLHPDLEELTKQLMSCNGIDRFSLTTNGTIQKSVSFWKQMKTNGLYKVNISMPDILEFVSHDILSETDVTKNSVIKNQLDTISVFNKLGIIVKINIAVINDIYYTKSILNYLYSQKNLRFDIVLLPNLSSRKTYVYSEKIISQILDSLHYRYIESRRRRNTSDTIKVYKNLSSHLLYVKGTMLSSEPYYLNSLCNKCNIKENCQEGFYGLRLEQINNQLYVRLCIHKQDNGAVLPADVFFKSPMHDELMNLWG